MPYVNFAATALTTGTNSGNILAGKTFEFVGVAAMKLIILGSATGLTVQIVNDTEIIALQEPIPVKSGLNIEATDQSFRWVGRRRQQIIVTNPTGGTLSYVANLEVQPVR